jgi:hypothetical protein
MRHKSSFLRLLTIGAFVVSFTPSVVLAAPYPSGNYRFFLDYDPERPPVGSAGIPGRYSSCITFTTTGAPGGYTQWGSWTFAGGGFKGDWRQVGDSITWYGFSDADAVFGTGLVQAATNLSGKYAQYNRVNGPAAATGAIPAYTGTWTIVKDTAACP